MPNPTETITYDFTLLPQGSEDEVVCLTPGFTEMYEKYFPVMKELHGDRYLEPGAYRVVIELLDGTVKAMSITRVYYY